MLREYLESHLEHLKMTNINRDKLCILEEDLIYNKLQNFKDENDMKYQQIK